MRPLEIAFASLLLGGCGGDSGAARPDADEVEEVDARDGDSHAAEADSYGDLDVAPALDTADLRPPDPCPWVAWDEGLSGGRIDYAAFDPRADGVVLAAGGGALARSLDGGATFVPWSEDLAVLRLAFPPDDPKVILAATGSGIHVSSDSGRSFEPLALSGLVVRALIVHPAAPQRVFAGVDGAGVMRSDDGGATFRAFDAGVPRMTLEALASPADDPDVVLTTGVLLDEDYAPTGAGAILRSDDGGRRWTTVSTDVARGMALAFCPSDARRVVAAVRRGALASSDGGLTWEPIAALAGHDVIDVAFAGGSCQRLFASAYQEGVFRVDGGASGVATPPSTAGLALELGRLAGTLAPDPRDPDALLLTSHAGLFRSRDAGASWVAVPAVRGMSMVDLAARDGRVWLTTWGNGLWTRSPDGVWSRVGAFPRDFGWLAAPLGDILMVGSANDVFVADRDGDAFAPAPGLFNATDALVLPATGEILVSTQVAGLMRSSAPTVSWSASNAGLGPFPTSAGVFIDARAVTLDPTRPGRLYLALRGAGVALSDDDGATWRRPDNALADKEVVEVFVDTTKGAPRLLASVWAEGMWLSLDAGETWSAASAGLESLQIIDVIFDAPTGRLYASERDGIIRVSEDGERFRSFDGWCLPVAGWGPLAISDSDGERWLVAATWGNRVVRHRLEP